ncbi:retrovirus-related pol polyprotein from transposon TNT 1-94 [Tanacetum coccineum]
MLKKFGLEDSKPMKTLMSSDTKLTKDEECESVDSTKYQGMIGSLLYITASRTDIIFSVCLCARFQEDPKTSHLEVVKRIFRYIKGTAHLGLWYPKGTGIEIVVYAESDHTGDYVDRNSTRGQICDNKYRVTFSEHDSEITKDGKVIGRGIRKKGLYVMKLGNKPKDKICLATIDENSMLWHRRLGHANMRLIQSLASNKLIRNLPKLKLDQHFCDACKIGKQAHASHKAKNIVSTT